MTVFHKPKIIIPIAALIALVAGVLLYGKVGVPPTVVLPDTSLQQIVSGSEVRLSFPKIGRVEEVLVSAGETVRKGQVLARLADPQVQGAITQAKGALDLARAQYALLNNQYSTTKKQQDLLVENAYRTLLSSGLEGVPDKQDATAPIISGSYACSKEGSYTLKPYASNDNDSGYSIQYSGLEQGVIGVKYDNPVSLGSCGLQVKFTPGSRINTSVTWTILIPNTHSTSYLANKNAYDATVSAREKVLADLAATIGESNESSVAKAQVSAAEGAYAAAAGAYQNNVITAPADGTISFVDEDLKVGQAVVANKTLITIVAN